jgi:acetyltransferase-like isoleucine patch superfamily enzyme
VITRIRSFISEPFAILPYAWTKAYLLWISSRPNIKIKGKLILSGIPLIEIDGEALLEISNNVTLTSKNRRYHLNLHSPVKLLADRPGAVIRIGENTRIHGTCVHACQSVTIGRNCLIAANCQIIDSNGHDLSFHDVRNRIKTSGDVRPVVIEDNVWVGANTFVLPGVVIGEGSVISANSVVTKSIPPMVLAGGNPAIVIRDFSNEARSS